jgi:hypothetical protein
VLKKIKIKLFNFLLRNVYNLTTIDGLLEVRFTNKANGTGFIELDGVRLPENEERELVAQAKQMLRMKGRKLIRKHMCADATNRLVNKSQTIEDMVAGKVMLYTLDMEQQVLERIATLSH